MEMVNGYVFLDLTKANVYSKALKVLGTDKPVVIKDGSGSPYFVDSLTLDGTSIIITKGGKTITIANDNTITNVGDIQNHLYRYVIIKTGSNFFTCEIISNKNVEISTYNDLLSFLGQEKYVATGGGDESDGSVVTRIYVKTNDIYAYGFTMNGGSFDSGGAEYIIATSSDFNDITITKTQLF